jgi:hypothetical protein
MWSFNLQANTTVTAIGIVRKSMAQIKTIEFMKAPLINSTKLKNYKRSIKMEELKLLVQMVASLPTLAIYVIIAFYIYKVTIIGSIYGVIRFAVGKLHDWAVTRKTLPTITQTIRFEDILNGITLNDEDVKKELIMQIKRVCGKNVGIDSDYIHGRSVEWLRQAIDDKELKDAKAKKQAETLMKMGSDLLSRPIQKKAKGGSVKSASARADGCAIRGKTRA